MTRKVYLTIPLHLPADVSPERAEIQRAFDEANRQLAEATGYENIVSAMERVRDCRRDLGLELLEEDRARRPEFYKRPKDSAGAIDWINGELSEHLNTRTVELRRAEVKEFQDLKAPWALQELCAQDTAFGERVEKAWRLLEATYYEHVGTSRPRLLDFEVHHATMVARELLVLHTLKTREPEASVGLVCRRLGLPEPIMVEPDATATPEM